MPRLGGRKLHYLLKLKEKEIKFGRDGFFDYLRSHQLLVPVKRSYTKTTYSKHWMKTYPNLLEVAEVLRPEEVFVSDITYVGSDEGVHYLSLVTDAKSRKIMGHHLSWTMKGSDTVEALKQVANQRLTTGPLIHHSDRGSQYCSALYQESLRDYTIQPSMTDGYDCYQNALAERVNGILKQEFLLYRCRTFAELKGLIAKFVMIYSHLRPHLSLSMRTPESVHRKISSEIELT